MLIVSLTLILVLWKCCCLPDDDNLEQILKTLQFDGSDDHLVRLTSARRQISQYFGDQDLSKEPIHILVELPVLESSVRALLALRFDEEDGGERDIEKV